MRFRRIPGDDLDHEATLVCVSFSSLVGYIFGNEAICADFVLLVRIKSYIETRKWIQLPLKGRLLWAGEARVEGGWVLQAYFVYFICKK